MLRERLFHRKNDITTTADQPSRRSAPRGWIRIALIVAALAAIAFVVYRLVVPTPSAATQVATAPVVQADLAVTISSSGSVKPSKALDLAFQSSGRVAEVYVKPNQQVAAGEKLARIDDQDLRLQVQQAQADLETAKARLQQAQEGKATPQDIAEGQATLQAAQAALDKARTGNVTPPDIREAEAGVRAAQAQLDALKNPSPDKVSAAETALAQAQTGLQSARDDLSAAKTNAQLTLQRSTDDLTKAQSTYATAKSNWEFVNETGQDPTTPTVTGADGKKRPNKLNDTQRQQYYDAYVQAQASLNSAEKAVQQAQVAYDNARQAEQSGVQQAETKVNDAQQQLAALRNPTPSAITQAQANLQQAQARLQKLRQGGTAADIQSAQAQVDSAKAGLERLTAPAAPSDVSIAQASVTQAQAKVDAAKAQLNQAVLTAPFSGTVTTVNVIPGSVVGGGSAGGSAAGAISLSDLSSLYVDVSVSESDVASIKAGQPVNITFDALPGKSFPGTVATVAAAATKQNNIVTYSVTVQFNPGTEAVKSGMTANVEITVQQHSNVIQVPSGAVHTQGPASTVDVMYQGKTATVQVETGLTNGTMTEIVRCVATNNQCLRAGDLVVVPGAAAQGGNAQGQNTLIQIGGGGGGQPSGPPRQMPLP